MDSYNFMEKVPFPYLMYVHLTTVQLSLDLHLKISPCYAFIKQSFLSCDFCLWPYFSMLWLYLDLLPNWLNFQWFKIQECFLINCIYARNSFYKLLQIDNKLALVTHRNSWSTTRILQVHIFDSDATFDYLWNLSSRIFFHIKSILLFMGQPTLASIWFWQLGPIYKILSDWRLRFGDHQSSAYYGFSRRRIFDHT